MTKTQIENKLNNKGIKFTLDSFWDDESKHYEFRLENGFQLRVVGGMVFLEASNVSGAKLFLTKDHRFCAQLTKIQQVNDLVELIVSNSTTKEINTWVKENINGVMDFSDLY